MAAPLGEVIEALRPHLPPGLVSETDLGDLREFAGTLPTAFSWGALEVRPGLVGAPVDLLLCASAADGDDDLLGEALFDDPLSLGETRPFLASWCSSGDALADQVPFVWLEFDGPGRAGSLPFLFFCLDPWFTCTDRDQRLETDDVMALARAGLEVLPPLPCEVGALQTLRRCADALPKDGRLMHLAPVSTRGRPFLRLVAGVPTDCVGPWLDRIGWKGSPRELDAAVALLGPTERVLGLHLDLVPGVDSELAFQVFRPLEDPHRADRRRILADRVLLGGMSESHAAGLLAWPGVSEVRLPSEHWPYLLERGLELKVRFVDGGPPRVKAYLGFHLVSPWFS